MTNYEVHPEVNTDEIETGCYAVVNGLTGVVHSTHESEADARELAEELNAPQQIRIDDNADGTYTVMSLDHGNDIWVLIEPGACTFENREDAEEYADRWCDLQNCVVVE